MPPLAEHEAVRARVIGITCIASLGGLPEVSLPLARIATGPVGLSLVAPRGSDGLLLDLIEAGIGKLRPAGRAVKALGARYALTGRPIGRGGCSDDSCLARPR